jgi:hypothetical protein
MSHRKTKYNFYPFNNFRNSEMFYEACESLRDMKIKKSGENSYISKSKMSIEQLSKSAMDKETNYHKIFSNFSTKKTDYTIGDENQVHKFMTDNRIIKNNNLESINLSPQRAPIRTIQNKSDGFVNLNNFNNVNKINDYHPISMKFNNNISAQSKINLNFNININCEANKKDKISSKVNNSPNLNISNNTVIYNDKSEKVETVYDTVRDFEKDENSEKPLSEKSIESEYSINEDVEKEFYDIPDVNKKIENILNFQTQNFENGTKSSIKSRKETFEDLISDVPIMFNKKKMSDIKFDVKFDIDMNFIRMHLKNFPVKVGSSQLNIIF